MKKIILAFVALAMMSCATPVVNQVGLYGVVEDVVYLNHHYHVKVWCNEKGKYYTVVTDRQHQKGDKVCIYGELWKSKRDLNTGCGITACRKRTSRSVRLRLRKATVPAATLTV